MAALAGRLLAAAAAPDGADRAVRRAGVRHAVLRGLFLRAGGARLGADAGQPAAVDGAAGCALMLGDRITPARALGLGCIVAGDLLVGGSSLLSGVFDGGQVWKGDLIFMSAAFCWSAYSVLARRFTSWMRCAPPSPSPCLLLLAYVPAFALLAGHRACCRRGWRRRPGARSPSRRCSRAWGSVVISGITFTTMVRALRAGALDHDHRAGAGAVGAGRGAAAGRAAGHWNLLAGLVLVTAGILFGVRAAVVSPEILYKFDSCWRSARAGWRRKNPMKAGAS
jgi:hypothetical protein